MIRKLSAIVLLIAGGVACFRPAGALTRGEPQAWRATLWATVALLAINVPLIPVQGLALSPFLFANLVALMVTRRRDETARRPRQSPAADAGSDSSTQIYSTSDSSNSGGDEVRTAEEYDEVLYGFVSSPPTATSAGNQEQAAGDATRAKPASDETVPASDETVPTEATLPKLETPQSLRRRVNVVR